MARVTLRRATPEDARWLDLWDRDADVIACSSDDPHATVAFEDTEWREELAAQDEYSQWFIGELDGRPIGAMQIIDPHLETSHYWGEIAPNLRAIDIWIGDAADHSKGYGETMMRLAFQRCFSDPSVAAIVIDPLAINVRAHKFYQRIGFVPVGRQTFGDADCLVHRLGRDAWRARFPDDPESAS